MEKSDLEEEKKRTEVKNGRDPPKGLPYPLPLPAPGVLFCRYTNIESSILYSFLSLSPHLCLVVVIAIKYPFASPIFMLCQRRTVPGEDPLPERLMVILT